MKGEHCSLMSSENETFQSYNQCIASVLQPKCCDHLDNKPATIVTFFQLLVIIEMKVELFFGILHTIL